MAVIRIGEQICEVALSDLEAKNFSIGDTILAGSKAYKISLKKFNFTKFIFLKSIWMLNLWCFLKIRSKF